MNAVMGAIFTMMCWMMLVWFPKKLHEDEPGIFGGIVRVVFGISFVIIIGGVLCS